jgi:hypothetical protein
MGFCGGHHPSDARGMPGFKYLPHADRSVERFVFTSVTAKASAIDEPFC